MNAGVATAAKRPKTGGRKPHELELDKGEGGNKLAEQTRFDCERHVWLPFTDQWFMHPTGPGVCVASYGSAPAARKGEIRAAVEAGESQDQCGAHRDGQEGTEVVLERVFAKEPQAGAGEV